MTVAALDRPAPAWSWRWRAPEFAALRDDARLFFATVLTGMRLQAQARRDPAAKVLILPSDPSDIVGAVGDDAMLSAIVAEFRARNPAATFTVLCKDERAAAIVRGLGHSPLALVPLGRFPAAFASLIAKGDYDAFVGMGADVLDGHYGSDIAKRILIAADLAARAGLRSVITGFSFAYGTSPELAKYYARLSPGVALNVRDAVSQRRLRAFARARPRLVADVAFTLRPGEPDPAAMAWIARMRAEGRRVIGFNAHPMLFPAGDRQALERAVLEAADAIEGAGDGLAWLLIPHDYRAPGLGDDGFLRPLAARLRSDTAAQYLEGRHSAADLKALARALDGLVTGRMHLAIAALGMGTPVHCLAYQGKFAGLYRHFGLAEDSLTDARTLIQPGAFAARLRTFVTELPELRSQVARALPDVLALARGNFEPVR